MITKQDIAIIAIRILALYMFLQGLSILPMSVTFGTRDPISFLISHEFVIFLISAILWFSARPLSRFFVSDKTTSSEILSNFSRESVEQMIFSIVGLILIVVTIPALSGSIAYHINIDENLPDLAYRSKALAGIKSHYINYLLKLLLGFLLLCFPSLVTEMVRLARGIIIKKQKI
ncbi:hypothetical protein D1BOALGB6SA_2797 [Olavius sp. associated proteobacterium Delta 1]|nr:hypothetical protein D1BOALGB6SA_2797 [Olavius sp. associated proteobacterium Delta 1]